MIKPPIKIDKTKIKKPLFYIRKESGLESLKNKNDNTIVPSLPLSYAGIAQIRF